MPRDTRHGAPGQERPVKPSARSASRPDERTCPSGTEANKPPKVRWEYRVVWRREGWKGEKSKTYDMPSYAKRKMLQLVDDADQRPVVDIRLERRAVTPWQPVGARS